MKNLKRNSILMVFIILSCISCRKDFLIQPSSVPTSFNTTFPYEMRDGIMVVQVEISGQVYDFIMDSGGLNLVSKELAEDLNLKAKFSRKFDGSQNGKTKIGFTTLENIRIGDIDFEETNIGIMDFGPINATGCYNFQGMIGPALMQNGIWEIDYQQQEITIASDKTDFDIPSTAEVVPFELNSLLQPKMKIEIGGRLETVKIDLGNSFGIKLLDKTMDKLTDPSIFNKVIDGYGRYARAINGYGAPNTTTFTSVNQVKIGNRTLTNELVTFKPTGSPTIGNGFFENYRVLLSFQDKEIILIPNSEIKQTTIHNFGFQPIFNNGSPSIGFIYTNSSAEKIGLHIDDTIIAINGHAIQNITDWCSIKKLLNNSIEPTLAITIERNGKQMDFVLEKMLLL